MRTMNNMNSRSGSRDSREPIVRTYDRDHPFHFEWREPPSVKPEDLKVGPSFHQMEKRSPFSACYLPPRVSVNACYIFDRSNMRQERIELLQKYHRSWITKDGLRAATLGYSRVQYAQKFDDEILRESILSVRDEFRDKLLKPLKSWTVSKVIEKGSLPQNTSPGLPYMQQFYKTKRDAWNDHQDTILQSHSAVRKGHRVTFPDCAAMSRSVVSTKDKNKVRLVWAYPLDMILLESKYVQPLLEAMIDQKIGTSVAYGAETQRGGMKWLNKQLTECPNMSYVCLDFSNFDQTIPPWLIRTAFDILEECFDIHTVEGPDGERKTDATMVSREWRAIRDYFINTPLRMEDGTRFLKKGGVPSGSCFTNLIDSIVNLIVVRYCLKATTTYYPSFLCVLGDDSVSAVLGKVNIDNIAKCAKEKFGMVVNVTKSYWTTNPQNVQFLGYYNYYGYPSRDEEPMLAGLLLPDSSVDESLGLTAARFLGITQAMCGSSAKVDYLCKRLFVELQVKGVGVTEDAKKLYHIRKMHGWLPAAGEDPEPLPDPNSLLLTSLPKDTCQKWVMNIDIKR
uniref:RNA-dependent RNA polymerase n=1 Tax=Hubei partiti-like virus 22 TaxID=1923029 RepID=A0A6F8PZ25_9VIRU|nr:RNA-dependent RNA polymerase [Hubei partiti-like virus 22]